MCYLIAKRFDEVGCIALQTSHGQQLAQFKKKLSARIGFDKIQLVTISRPSAYGEYEPYQFINSEEDFEKEVLNIFYNTQDDISEIDS